MKRSAYKGAVRDGGAETARDERMLALSEKGLPVTIIAHRMGVTVNSARQRIKRALAARPGDFGTTPMNERESASSAGAASSTEAC